MNHRTHIGMKNGMSDLAAEHNDGPHENVYARHVEGLNSTELVQDISSVLPWSGVSDADEDNARQEDGHVNMDRMPTHFELHSATKTHQLGGLYESSSAFYPD